MWGVAEERPLSVATGCVAARVLQHDPRPANFYGFGSAGNLHKAARLYSPESTRPRHIQSLCRVFSTLASTFSSKAKMLLTVSLFYKIRDAASYEECFPPLRVLYEFLCMPSKGMH